VNGKIRSFRKEFNNMRELSELSELSLPSGEETRRPLGAAGVLPRTEGTRQGVKCTTCGRPARRVKPGPSAPVIRWPALCSPECQLAELDRLIGTLRERREKIAAFIAQRRGRP
jgi:hypothetical protein